MEKVTLADDTWTRAARPARPMMTPTVWMIVASLASALAVQAVLGQGPGVAVVAGMLAPLVAATWSWTVVERTFKRRPEDVTAVMMTAFAAKVVFFGAYVAVAIKGLSLDPIPFAVSFTVYFVALYLAEALCLRRLFADGMRTPVERR